MINLIRDKLDALNINLDIKNEARVHLWYEKKFHRKIKPYTSVEDAISKWGTTVTCIGVRMEHNKLLVYAPYGLNDLFGLILRPVKESFIKKDYEKKVVKWTNKWPLLKVIKWEK